MAMLSFRVVHHLQSQFSGSLIARTSSRCFYSDISRNSSYSSNGRKQQSRWKKAAVFGVGAASSLFLYKVFLGCSEKEGSTQAKSVPIYTSDDVAKHNSKDSGIWVSYKDGVYDITRFVDSHPGGDKILLGAGGPIDAFWNMYAVHQTPEVLEILHQYRIGNLSKKDQKVLNLDDPFAKEPPRLPVFKVNSAKPFNAEPPVQLLTDSFITPNELFYVRNHLPVPDIDPESYKLKVEIGGKKLELSLHDLKTKYKPVTITTTIQCAGNRRQEMSQYKEVKGLSWGLCAIGTARWTGLRLREVLLDAGFDPSDKSLKHIHFNGSDIDISKSCYGASIPVKKAMSCDGDVILAYKMNGVDIPRDHGFPIRVIVPGYVGARNVKWVHHIAASHEESHSHWQRKDYKLFSPTTTFATANYDTAPSIQEMPVISAISTPGEGSIVYQEDGHIDVEGYAWSGGGRDIIRVEVSPNGGKTWKEATLTRDQADADDSSHNWAWTLWHVELPANEGEELELVCRATDSANNCQPESVGSVWNLRGFMSNAWHRVPVKVARDED